MYYIEYPKPGVHKFLYFIRKICASEEIKAISLICVQTYYCEQDTDNSAIDDDKQTKFKSRYYSTSQSLPINEKHC